MSFLGYCAIWYLIGFITLFIGSWVNYIKGEPITFDYIPYTIFLSLLGPLVTIMFIIHFFQENGGNVWLQKKSKEKKNDKN